MNIATAHQQLDEQLRRALLDLNAGPGRDGLVPADYLWELFRALATSRHCDFAAREMQAQGRGYYTISSAGHEANAVVAAALRPTDPALLHYRSGAFYLWRAAQVGLDGVPDILQGVAAGTADPISGGRHKVFGRVELAVLPQTSTIASHLPRAVGVAFAIERAKSLGVPSPWPQDAVVVCSFGDASANHSTAAGALNTAGWTAHQGISLPLLLVCEDNGIGISVRTPPGWIDAMLGNRAGVRYFTADGADVEQTARVSAEAVEYVRERRAPAVLHLRTVRFLGHAGSDVESAYRSRHDITADFARDPLIATARALTDGGVSGAALVQVYDDCATRVRSHMIAAMDEPHLTSASQVMAPLARHRPEMVQQQVSGVIAGSERTRRWQGRLPETEGPLTLAQTINRTLADLAFNNPEMLIFGEDVARKGGVYGVTRGLHKLLGPATVFDTVLDEQTILGTALGAGISGLLPIPEIQYLAYLHNAEDQLRGEAASQQFFSNGQFANPMVVRIAGYGYQKGFGGHFHNDNSVAVLRDIPGLVIASPSHPSDAAPMLRTCVAAAKVDGRVVVFLEPIALYHTRDLYEPDDGEWASPYCGPAAWEQTHVPIGKARVILDGTDLTIVTFGNGVPMSLRVAKRLRTRNFDCGVLDLRWLAPLPIADILDAARVTGRILIVDETRRSGGVSEGIMAGLLDAGFSGSITRVTSEDSFIPLGPAARAVLLSEQTIEQAAGDMLSR